jgi:hypothetical protein
MSYGLVLVAALGIAGQEEAPARPAAWQEAKEYWGKERLSLKAGALAKFAKTGGMRGRSEEIVIRQDGTVVQTIVQMGKPSTGSWRVAPTEMVKIRAEIAATPFKRLRMGPRTDHPAAAVDGIDYLYMARRKDGIQWWSSGHWQAPENSVKFFDRMQHLASTAGG